MRRIIIYPLCITLIILIVGSVAASESIRIQRERIKQFHKLDFRHRMIVYLRSTQDLEFFKKQLPKTFRIMAQQEEMLILSSSSELKEQDLSAIQKLPMVRTAKLDLPVMGQESHTGIPDCHKSQETLPLTFLKTVQGILKTSKSSTCNLEEICPNMNIEKLWAQHAVDADLMNEYIESRNLRKKGIRTSVAVVDTGFDTSQLSAMMQEKKILVLPGVYGVSENAGGLLDDTSFGIGSALVPDAGNDVNGHGTMVTSMIAGKGGQGVAPRADVSVYRVTEDDRGDLSMAYIEYAVRYACNRAKKDDPKSTPIINLSSGDRLDEMGERRDETSPLMEFLLKKGCIVTKASGNDSFVFQDSSNNGEKLDDPYLRVAATSQFGGRASFSSNGEVNVPGNNVYVRISSLLKDKPEKTCDGDKNPTEAFVNGTSFAAPMAAGIMSEVLGVLRSGTKFDDFSPEKRIALLNRIISASNFSGTINGLRAVMIAEAWVNQASSDSMPSVLQLQDLLKLNRHPLCDTPSSACQKSDTCSNECYKQTRIRVSACVPPLTQDSIRLFHQLADSGAVASAARALRTIDPKGNELQITALRAELSEKFFNQVLGTEDWASGLTKEGQAKLGKALDQNFAEDLMSGFLKYSGEKRDEKSLDRSKKILRVYLESDVFVHAMNSGPARGSGEVLKTALNRLQELREQVGDQRFITFLKEILEDNSSEGNIKKLLVAMRIMNGMHADPKFASLLPKLKDLDDSIFTGMDKNNIKDNFPRYEEVKTDMSSQNIQFTQPYYYEFLERKRPMLIEQLKKWDPDTISLTKLEFASLNASRLFNNIEEKKDFLLKTALAQSIRSEVMGRDKGSWSLSWLSDDVKREHGQLDNYVRSFLKKVEDPIFIRGAIKTFNGKSENLLGNRILNLSEEEVTSLSIKAMSTISKNPLSKNYSENFTNILWSLSSTKSLALVSQERYREAIGKVLESQLQELKVQPKVSKEQLDFALRWINPLIKYGEKLNLTRDSYIRDLMKRYVVILQSRVSESDDLMAKKDEFETWLNKK